jgi:hypothetical protein
MAITQDAVCWPTVEAAILTRIAEIQLDLETAPIERVPFLQGACQELRLLITAAEPTKPTPSGPLTY